MKQSNYELRIDLEDFDGNTRYARYKYFEIGTAAEKFKLRAEVYTGDAGKFGINLSFKMQKELTLHFDALISMLN